MKIYKHVIYLAVAYKCGHKVETPFGYNYEKERKSLKNSQHLLGRRTICIDCQLKE
ncbi:hypothetical protein [Priestia endophytica]|uniref:hypothetical protein n=1 Tax=Priestia endophytica TaxID=135735 RepID=UPI00203FC7E5|nr:hypothetical protein [Priestia endophytica]MCM3536577.1 hypothetical protein [Priestia endophytica]